MKKMIFVILVTFSYAFYDNTLYKYMYESFVNSKDLKDAYIVAKKALIYKPGDLKWKKRFADVAWGLGKNEEAYNNFLFIYKKTHSVKIRNILFLFPYWQTFEIKRKVYEKEFRNGNYSHVVDLAEVYLKLGYPEKSLEVLKKAYKYKKDKKILKEMLKVAVALDNMDLIFEYINDLKALSLNEKINIAALFIYFNHYKKAYELLKYVNKIPTNPDYYKYMIYISYKMRMFKQMILLLEYELKEKKINKGDLDLLLSFYYYKKDYKMLEFLLKEALKINKAYVKNYLEVLIAEHKYKKAFDFIEKNRDLFNEKEYLYETANIYIKLKKFNLAKENFLKLAENYHLNNIQKSNILWFVINYTDYKFFKKIKKYINLKGLDYQLMLVYFKYGFLDKAYFYGAKILPYNQNNLSFLLTFSDILSTEGKIDEAYFYKLKAWKIVNKKLKNDSSLMNKKDFFITYFNLAQTFLSGDEILNLLNKAKKILDKESFINLEFSYYFNINKEKCFYIYNYKKAF